jgi:adenine-specific DNA-methyltransferase
MRGRYFTLCAGFLRPQIQVSGVPRFFYALFSRMEIKEILENTLRKEPNLLSDKGEIKKWIVINKAQNYDETLLGLLLDEPRLKTIFFKEIKQAWVFNLNLFTGFIEQKEFLPDSYTGFPNKIGLQIGGKFLRQRNEVSLVWPYKDCVLEGGQSREEDTRKEIFFNELLAQDEITQLFEPKVITNLQYFGDATELNQTSNLLIKGNNLLALHSLKKCFTGKVKLIYIDPPYNTGNDGFRYNDSFNHSSWLTFMKNRLEVAKTLLREDGTIAISIDQNESIYTQILCDEIFGRKYRKNNITRQIAR